MREYDREHYNCSHVVAEYYRDRLGIELPSGSPAEWGLRFVKWMRARFTQSPHAVQDCLVLMRGKTLHVGVYDDYMVMHGHTVGQVIRTPVTLLKPLYQQITYWVYNGND